jgi:hypothetical protein
MPGLSVPAGVTVRYGTEADGYTFPVSLEPVQITETMVYDKAERVVAGVRFNVRLSCLVYPLGLEASAITQMVALRAALSKPAHELTVTGTGFGTLVVNRQGGQVWDMAWGPRPKVVITRQVGDHLCWKIDWECETLIPEDCPEVTRPGRKRPFEWNYQVRWSIDEKGLTRRVVSGHVRIPLTRLTPEARTVPDSADALREAVATLDVPVGFRRTPGEFTLSEDRRTLNFSVTDSQLQSGRAPPPGVVDVQARHEVSNGGQYQFFRHVNTLTANYTVAQSHPKSVAWQHFVDLVRLRRLAAKEAGMVIIPLTLSLSESIYTTESSFTIRYATIPREGVIGDKEASEQFIARLPFSLGMWQFPANSDWGNWRDSMQDGAFHPRGFARMAFDPKDDRLVNLCVPDRRMGGRLNSDVEPPPGRRFDIDNEGKGGGGDRELRTGGGGGDATRVLRTGGVGGAALKGKAQAFGDPPPPQHSYLEYLLKLKILPTVETAALKLLGGVGEAVRRRVKDVDSADVGGWVANYLQPRRIPHVVQHRAEPTFRAVFTGQVIRAGYNVAIPELTEISGVKAIPIPSADDFAGSEILGNLLTPLCVAAWRKTYLLETTPTRPVLPPDNPVSGRFKGGDLLKGFEVLFGG